MLLETGGETRFQVRPVDGVDLPPNSASLGTLDVGDVKRLKQLELENARLKKLLAERDLDVEVMREINAKKW